MSTAQEKEAQGTATSEVLLTPYRVNDLLTFKNRIVMAPMTRCMADEDLVPTADMAAYYARRASAGMIISEATIIRRDGLGYPNTPGIYTDAQIEGWRGVTKAVHDAGGKIFSQIWHVGRISHSMHLGGELPVAPSAIKLDEHVSRAPEGTMYETPRPLEIDEIKGLVQAYAQAAENAITAGFDGVEIHGANGYLIDQFLHYDTNRREDVYGGSPQAHARFALEVVDAVLAKVDPSRVGIRLAPAGYAQMNEDPRDGDVFRYLLPELSKRNLAYVHAAIFFDTETYEYLDGKTVCEFIRAHYDGTTIGVGSYTPETAAPKISDGVFDLIALGRLYIPNPDLVDKVASGATLIDYDEAQLATLE